MTRFARDTRWPLNLNQTPSQLYKRRSAEANHALSHSLDVVQWLVESSEGAVAAAASRRRPSVGLALVLINAHRPVRTLLRTRRVLGEGSAGGTRCSRMYESR